MNLKPNYILNNLIKTDDVLQFRQLITDLNSLYKLNTILQQRYRSSIIHLCAKFNAYKICEFILENFPKVFVNNRDFEGKTPLHTACIFEALETSRILIKNGAEVNDLKRGDWTPLMIAVTKSNIQLICLLLENGSDVTMKNKDGWNIFHLAVRSGQIELIKLLASYLKNFNLEQLWYDKVNTGRTIMHIAAIHGHIPIFNFIIENLALDYLHSEDISGTTPFMDAARANCVPICQSIYEYCDKKKFNVNDCDYSKRTALHLSAQTNACESIKFLSSINCKLDLQDLWKQSSLFLAVREGHFEATELLIKLGANKNLKDSENRTLIDICSQYGHNDMRSLLL